MKNLTLSAIVVVFLGTIFGTAWFLGQPAEPVTTMALLNPSSPTSTSETSPALPDRMLAKAAAQPLRERNEIAGATYPASHSLLTVHPTSQPALTLNGQNRNTGGTGDQVPSIASDSPALGGDTDPTLISEDTAARATVSSPSSRQSALPSGPTLTLYLPPGVREPAAFLPTPDELSVQQADALGAVSDEFVTRLEEAAASRSEQKLTETWDVAQEEADSQYRILFGDVAYNRMLMEAAIADMARSRGVR